jgi:hypothetical protein
MIGFFAKIWMWLKLNAVAIFGISQGILKVIKELLTAVIDVLFPLIPNAVFHKIVLAVRSWVNTVDEWIETIKNWIYPKPVE